MTFRKLANYFAELEKNSSRIKITEILAQLFKETDPSEIDKICYLSLGRLAPAYAGVEFNLAEKLLIKVLAQVYGKETKEIKEKDQQLGDLGNTAEFFDKRESAKRLTVKEVYQRLWGIATESGAGSVERKVDKMAGLIDDLDSLSAKFIVRIPLGRLRLGFSELTIMDALSWMLTGDKSKRGKIEAAYNVRADIGQIAQLIKKRGINGLKGVKVDLGVPIMPALSQRLPTADEMIEKMGKVAVEPKYDGTRLAVHFAKNKMVRMFTRNLENITQMFPDIAESFPRQVKAKEVIFDGEAIGYDPKTGKFLPFQETIKRKRKYEICKKAKEIPLKYFVFDILYKDGKELIGQPFNERRQILEKTISGSGAIMLSPQIVTENSAELRCYHNQQLKKGLEGVMVKKWQATYDPGRRGYTWVKFKQEKKGKRGGGLADTLDCVIMGYYLGRGKRVGFGVGAFLVGIRESADSDKLLTISKIGTGLSDEQWREMHKRGEKMKTEKQPKQYQVDKNMLPDVWCIPKIVVEIEADNITISPIHTASLALRFPRLIRFRDDKSFKEATTLSEAKKIYRLQK